MSEPYSNRFIRRAAIAGTFYPADSHEIHRELDRLFPTGAGNELWRAVLIPHAGWIYSAHIAAAVLARVRVPETVLVLCPKHTRGGSEWAVSPYDAWEVPFGQLQADTSLARQLAEIVPGLELDPVPHEREHAIEVELPLLAHVAPDVRVVGITVGAPSTVAGYEPLVNGLQTILQERGESVLLVVSSDMNHFANDKENRRLDTIAIEAMQSLNPKRLVDQCQQHRISMCGRWPAFMAMESLRRLGWLDRCEQVAYGTSANVNGDHNRVVGYAGLLFGSRSADRSV